jgi:hypothetical protein
MKPKTSSTGLRIKNSGTIDPGMFHAFDSSLLPLPKGDLFKMKELTSFKK